MTIYVWMDYVYYDTLWGASQMVVDLDPASPITSATARWLDCEATVIQETQP